MDKNENTTAMPDAQSTENGTLVIEFTERTILGLKNHLSWPRIHVDYDDKSFTLKSCQKKSCTVPNDGKNHIVKIRYRMWNLKAYEESMLFVVEFGAGSSLKIDVTKKKSKLFDLETWDPQLEVYRLGDLPFNIISNRIVENNLKSEPF